MPIVRILVDGYSLLHSWPELAPGKARYSAHARDELIHKMILYRDAIGTPMTIVFDGAGLQPDASQVPSTPECEIIYSRAGQTADQIIERVAAAMKPYGEVLAVTDDNAERDMVISLGGHASSCLSFINVVESTLKDFEGQLKNYNSRERKKYKGNG